MAHCPFFFSALDALPACADPSSVYHWIGEMFLGAWRIWSNHAWRSGLALPPLRTVAFPSQWSEEEAPDDAKGADIWEDVPGANMWYTRKFL